VALVDGRTVVQQRDLPAEQRSAQSLPGVIQALLHEQSLLPPDLGLIAVTAGPGSFTGLRVGLMTAKTLAYARGKNVLGINTLEVIARQSAAADNGQAQRIHAVLDAQRQQLFAATWEQSPAGTWTAHGEVAIVEREVWLKSLAAEEIVTGPGLLPLVGQLPTAVRVAAEANWQPQAGMVGILASEHWERGQRDDWKSLAVQYYRQSAAEEKRASMVKNV
jgi:tRNA threonylcarbamoyladenosine biosynthesis protein TsaB